MLKTWLKRAFIVAAVAVLPVVGLTTPAQAGTDTKICNSSDSTDQHRIFAWIINGGPGYFINHGDCGPWFGYGDNVRVDTCPDNNVFNYYQLKTLPGSYGPKHYGCNSNSNPPTGQTYYRQTN